jgi:ABC-type transport system substrate-binding protein
MHQLRTAFAALAMAVAMTSANPVASENVLRWWSVGGAATIDPHGFDEGPTWAQLSQVYEGLIGVDSNLELVPRLAVA